MKEAIVYNPYNDSIMLCLKDDRRLTNGKWKQRWWFYNGERSLRPDSNESALSYFENCLILESARYLDEYR